MCVYVCLCDGQIEKVLSSLHLRVSEIGEDMRLHHHFTTLSVDAGNKRLKRVLRTSLIQYSLMIIITILAVRMNCILSILVIGFVTVTGNQESVHEICVYRLSSVYDTKSHASLCHRVCINIDILVLQLFLLCLFILFVLWNTRMCPITCRPL